jgi:hypothetical protein
MGYSPHFDGGGPKHKEGCQHKERTGTSHRNHPKTMLPTNNPQDQSQDFREKNEPNEEQYNDFRWINLRQQDHRNGDDQFDEPTAYHQKKSDFCNDLTLSVVSVCHFGFETISVLIVYSPFAELLGGHFEDSEKGIAQNRGKRQSRVSSGSAKRFMELSFPLNDLEA